MLLRIGRTVLLPLVVAFLAVAVLLATSSADVTDARPRRTPRPTATLHATPIATPRPTPKPTPTPTPRPTPTPTPTPTATSNPGSCTLFPANNVWNKDISGLPVRTDSTALLTTIGLSTGLHPDFSNAGAYGIPYNIVGPSTPRYTVGFYYPTESDPGPYPIPANPLIEAPTDSHLLAWDTSACFLYEIFDASVSGGVWSGGSGAIWDLRSNALRPDGWTSADAAGLPILPGLVRYDEVAAGLIAHALRFTAPRTQTAHIYPARHDAGSSSSASYPPMGLRVRLKASVNISGFGPQARVLLTALQHYGMILADNGSAWYISGAPSPSWNDDELHLLNQITGSMFEAVDTSGLVNGP
ncbi:MAG: hypothetical protein ACRDF7_01570 [Candidatus Limnocylindrales bacterium]